MLDGENQEQYYLERLSYKSIHLVPYEEAAWRVLLNHGNFPLYNPDFQLGPFLRAFPGHAVIIYDDARLNTMKTPQKPRAL